MKKISNRFWRKRYYHKKLFKDIIFRNVKIQACSLTSCVFKNATFEDVDFVGVNLKKSVFTGAKIKNVTFTNCNLKGTRWKEPLFDEVAFIMTNVKECDFQPIAGYTEMKTYPQIELDDDMIVALQKFSEMEKTYKYHVLHVNREKPNMWNIKILINKFGSEIGRELRALSERENIQRMCSLGSYIKLLEMQISRKRSNN